MVSKKVMFWGMVGLLMTGTVQAGFFENNEWGARPVGLGGNFVAVADDVNAVVWNPAGIARLNTVEGTFMYAKPYSLLDLGANYASLAYPLRTQPASIGIAWMNYNYPEQASENTYIISYGRKLNKEKTAGAIYAGISVKILTLNILDSSIVNDFEMSKTNYTADIGALYFVNKQISVGVSARNLIECDTTFQKGKSGLDKITREILAGVAYFVKGKTSNMIYTAGAINTSVDTQYQLGAEYWQKMGEGAIGIRGGYNPQKYGVGASYKQDKFRIDGLYTIQSVFMQQSNGINVALSYQFGDPITREEVTVKKKKRVVEEEVTEEEETPKIRKKAKPKIEEEVTTEEEETPKLKKKAKPVVEEEVTEEEAPKPKKKVKPTTTDDEEW